MKKYYPISMHAVISWRRTYVAALAVFFIITALVLFRHTRMAAQLGFVSTPTSVPSPTPSCTGTKTDDVEEGPYYTPNSPERTDIGSANTTGTPVTVTGYVLDTNCKPVVHAWVDFWQADGKGVYDNQGYTLRGHQFTDSNGRYILKTILPGVYPGRPPHIHAKVRAADTGPTLTTQIFFPIFADKNIHDTDPTYRPSLLTKMTDRQHATFDFVISR